MGLFKRLSSFAPHYVLTTNNRTKFKDLPTLGVQGSTIDYNRPTEYRDIQLVDWEKEFGEGGGGGKLPSDHVIFWAPCSEYKDCAGRPFLEWSASVLQCLIDGQPMSYGAL